MNIAVVSHLFPTARNPAQGIFIKKEISHLAREHNLSLLIPSVFSTPFDNRHLKHKNPSTPEGISYTKVPYLSFPYKMFPGIIRFNLAFFLKREVKSVSPDLLHIHWLYPDGLAIPMLKYLDIPILLTIHGSDWYKSITSNKLQKYLSDSLDSADRILTVGERLKKDIIKKFPNYKNKIFVQRHGVDLNFFKPPSSKDEIRLELGWAMDSKHLIMVGNIVPEKGVDVLLQAIGRNKEKFKNAHLHIVYASEKKAYTKYCNKIIAKYNLSNQISFYQSIKPERLSKFYQASNLCILPSRKEGFGLSLIEAAATGLPVLATKSGGPEMVVNDKIGKLVNPENAEELSNALLYMIKNLEKYNSTVIRNYIKDNFSIKKSISAINGHYHHLMT